MSMPATALAPISSCGARLVSIDGKHALPLRSARFQAEAGAGLARVRLEQTFANPHDLPLVVTYALPLPHDAAVSAFAFRIGSRRIVGEIDRHHNARARYEEALLEGRTAALLEQERGSLFTQQVGNIPPGQEVVAEITIDQPLAWLVTGDWEWRFPLVAAPRYLGAEGRVTDAEAIAQDVTLSGDGPVLDLELAIHDRISENAQPGSPSHSLRCVPTGETWQVVLADDAAHGLDRDLVARWHVGTPAPSLGLATGRPETECANADAAYGLLTVVPPTSGHEFAARSRDLILLIDTSGSMSGQPLQQAKRIATALVERLGPADTLEMVEFSSRPRRWQPKPVDADPETIHDAVRWLTNLQASGATEMEDGVREALRAHREGAQRQVVLITDGLVGFEQDIVRSVWRALPSDSRLHCVGVGSAPNRSLTAACARAGRGVEVHAGLDTQVDEAVARLLARLQAPLVTELSIEGAVLLDIAPRALPDLYAGAPARIALRLRPEGGTLTIRGATAEGPWQQCVEVPSVEAGTGPGAIAAHFARERVEDLEIDLAAGGNRTEIDTQIERIGLAHGIATRMTSWVAISEEPDVDPRKPYRRVRQPQQPPHGMSAEGLGLATHSTIAHRLSMNVGDFPCAYAEFESRRSEPPSPREMSRHVQPKESRSRETGIKLTAHLVHKNESHWIFELLVLRGEFEWALPDVVELIWDRGTRHLVEVDVTATTEPGVISEDGSIRLVLHKPEHVPDSAPVEIQLRSKLFGTRRVRVG